MKPSFHLNHPAVRQHDILKCEKAKDEEGNRNLLQF